MKKIQLLIVIFTIIIASNSCTKKITEIEYKEKEGYWNHYLFSNPFYNFITNGLAVDDKLIVTCYNSTFVFDDLKIEPRRFGGGGTIGYKFKPALSKEITANREMPIAEQITFDRHTEGGHPYTVMHPEQFGEKFKNYRFKQLFYYNCEIGAFNSKNRFVSLIALPRMSGLEINEHIVYIDIMPYGSQTGGIAISDFGVLEIPSMNHWKKNVMNFSNIVSYKDKFYFAFRGLDVAVWDGPNDPEPGFPYNGTHYVEVSDDGSIREFITHLPENYLPGHINTFFVYKDYLFAQLYFGDLIYTSDGENWIFTDKLNTTVTTFREIDDFIFFHFAGIIYFFEPIGGNLQNLKLYHIQTDNIKDKTISSINKFKDDLIITTSSGIFYKKLTDVINDAEPEKSRSEMNNGNKNKKINKISLL